MKTNKLQQAKAQSIESMMNTVSEKIKLAKTLKRTRLIYCLIKTHQKLAQELDRHTNYTSRISKFQ